MQKNKNKSFKRWEQKTQTFPRLFPDLHEMSSSSDLYRSNNKYKKYNLYWYQFTYEYKMGPQVL